MTGMSASQRALFVPDGAACPRSRQTRVPRRARARRSAEAAFACSRGRTRRQGVRGRFRCRRTPRDNGSIGSIRRPSSAPRRPPVIEQRRYARAPINSPASFSRQGEGREGRRARQGHLRRRHVHRDRRPPPASAPTSIVHVDAARRRRHAVALPGVVRWVRDGGMGVQFGLLGAVETHIITEIYRKHGETAGG